jgi:hypothetical protein
MRAAATAYRISRCSTCWLPLLFVDIPSVVPTCLLRLGSGYSRIPDCQHPAAAQTGLMGADANNGGLQQVPSFPDLSVYAPSLQAAA